MHKYEVGKLYTDRTRWPELAQYNYRGGEHELVLFLNKPTSAEIHAIQKEQAELALFVERSLIIMLYRFGRGLPWSDAPYSIHLVPREQRTTPPDVGTNDHALLHIILVDGSNGIIRALRVISMPPDFTQTLHRSIQKQSQTSFTRANYNGELETLFASYSSADLAQMSSIRFLSMPSSDYKT